jgi:deoxyribodipyrimidine photolyase-related protein
MPIFEVERMFELSQTGTSKGFASQIKPCGHEVKAWVWVCYDQLNLKLFDSIQQRVGSIGLVFIESEAKGRSRPYHKQKIALLLSNMRHFALEAQSKGFPIRYYATKGGYHDALESIYESLGPIHCIEAAERSTRIEVESLIDSGHLFVHPHTGWLTPRTWFTETVGDKPPFRMDRFYRNVRKKTGWLMIDHEPIGGKYSFDEENRKAWKGDPRAPAPPVYQIDSIDEEVGLLIESVFSDHPGTVDFGQLPTSEMDVSLANNFAADCMVHFGTYEDAMSTDSRGLWHTRLASLLNLHRTMPKDAVEMALKSTADLNNVEGFLRQLIWREYVHHIHDVTDGFRTLEVNRTLSRRDANWHASAPLDGEPHPNHLEQTFPLPQAYWGRRSGMACLDESVKSVMEEGWTHHIPRLMVLSNIAHLVDVHPRQLTDWFHVAFIDAYDWVVEPNVLGMGTFALGSAMMTKPYVAGSAYINRMSNHCKSCEFHPKKTCPISRLYWAYLDRHSDSFKGNHRLSMAMRNVAKRSEEQRSLDHQTYLRVQEALANGTILHPEDQ